MIQNAESSEEERVITETNDLEEEPTIEGIEKKLQQELAESRQLNRITQETIDYLIAENRELRKRCERYLKALALLVE